MTDKFYYKIINDNTGAVVFYVNVNFPVQDDKVCEVLNLKGHHAENITKDEFVRETEDLEDE